MKRRLTHTVPGTARDCAEIPPRVCFVFSSQGIGGAERSMARMIAEVHPQLISASVLFAGGPNPPFEALLEAQGDVPYQSITLRQIRKGVRFLSEVRPAIIYGFGLRRIVWSVLGRLAGASVFVGAERNSLSRRVDIASRHLDRYLLDGYIANSQRTADLLGQRIGIRASKIRVAYNGISPGLLPESDAAKPHDWGDPTLICVANLQERKGHIYLLRAVAKLRRKYPRLKVILIGTDLTNGRLLQEASREGLSDTFHWLGFKPEVMPLLRVCDAFVLPSTCHEGMPTAILEAMYVGLPVVATDVGGTSELVVTGETGFLVPPGSTVELADKIDALLSSRLAAQEMGAQGRQRVLSTRSVDAMARAHIDAFREFCASKTPGPGRVDKVTFW